MNSRTTEKFRLLFANAAPERQARIRGAYRLWLENPSHPSLRCNIFVYTEDETGNRFWLRYGWDDPTTWKVLRKHVPKT